MLKLTNTNGNIELARKMMKGDDGGYYIPSVVDGELTWTPSLEGMTAVDEKTNIIGPKGEPGEPGFYVGIEEPTGEQLVWINPDGDSLSEFATIDFVREEIAAIPEVDLTGLATEEFVNKEIDVIEKSVSNCASKESLGAYAKLTDLNSYAKKKDIPSIDGLATERYVDEVISNMEIPDAIDDYVVNISFDETYQEYSTDKTSQQISQAYQNGQNIIARVNMDGIPGQLFPIVCADLMVVFGGVMPSLGGDLSFSIYSVIISSDKVTYYFTQAATQNDLQSAWAQAIEIISQDFALKTEIPDISNLASIQYVNDAISNIEVSGDAEDFIVSFTANYIDDGNINCVCDKTIEEIREAYAANKNIVATISLNGLPIRLNPVICAEGHCIFIQLEPTEEGAATITVFMEDGVCNVIIGELATADFALSEIKNYLNGNPYNYATKEFVEDAISNIEITGGGGGGGNYIATVTRNEEVEEGDFQAYLSDKTSMNMYSAFEAGKNVYVQLMEGTMPVLLKPLIMTNVYCIFSGTYLYEDEQRGQMQVTYLVNLINTISTVARVESYTARAIDDAMIDFSDYINSTFTTEERVGEIVDTKIADALGVIENGTY